MRTSDAYPEVAQGEPFLGSQPTVQNESVDTNPMVTLSDSHMNLMMTRQMLPHKSMAIYPRLDNFFRKKHSYNFDMMKSEVMMNRRNPKGLKAFIWLGYFFIGMFTGATAFGMSKLEDFLSEKRTEFMEHLIKEAEDSMIYAWLFGLGWCIVFAGMATLLTLFVGPGANGSGIAECMAVFNGVNYHDFIGKRTLFTKVFGVVFAIVSFIFIGKEGPLAHIGAIMS
jgi:hypothetical protein